MNKTNKTFFLLLLIIISAMLIFTGCSNGDNESKAQKLIDYQATKYDSSQPSGKLVQGVREIDVTATKFFWEPNMIVVNEGEKVRLKIATIDVPHGFEIEGLQIPGYDINTKIEKGKPITVEFEATEKGSWDVLCTIYCGAGHGSMKAKFIIK